MAQEDGRCVLTLPLLTETWQEHILEKRFKIVEHLQNSLIALELRKLKNLKRTRAFRELEKQIGETPAEKRKPLYRQRQQLLRNAGFSEFEFKNDITPMQKHFAEHIATHVAHRAASDVWRAFEKYLYGSGHEVHFKRRGSLNSAANQQAGTTMSYKDNVFVWSGGRSPNAVSLKIKVALPDTEYERLMLQKQCKYFRVIRKWMKTRYKYYLQLTLVGNPVHKERSVGNGRVGIDIGTQSIAIASQQQVQLLELADQVNTNHSRMLQLQRKMEASRRATNPDNYAADGTIKRGVRLKWQKSKRYHKLEAQARQLQRKNADIRKYQHTCLANHILALGCDVYVEDMNYKALQRRAKETQIGLDGRYKRKKRFGKSLANKAPAMLLQILDVKLKSLGMDGLKRVDQWAYKASQYDHLSQQYHKKKLSTRIHVLENGDRLQRDLYSAFLIMNADPSLQKPDQQLCEQNYPNFKYLHDLEMKRLSKLDKPLLSSFGIRQREPQANMNEA